MTYLITERTATGARTYIETGDLGQILDAAYTGEVLGVTAMVQP